MILKKLLSNTAQNDRYRGFEKIVEKLNYIGILSYFFNIEYNIFSSISWKLTLHF